MLGSLMLVILAASPVFASLSMGGAEPGGKDDPGPPLYYVVQFEGPIQQEWKDQVTGQGGERLGYIPYFAFKVRMNPAQAREVGELESVGAVLPFLPKYKLSPRLESEGTNLYRVKVERGADAGLVVAAVAKTDAQILGRQGNILLLAADADQLKPIAEILDVAWVENFAFHEKHNEYGAGVIMGADTANANGYDGSTQTVAIADTGLGGGTSATAHGDIPSSRITAIHSWNNGNNNCWNVVEDGAQDVASGHGTHVTASVLGGGTPVNGELGGEGRGTALAANLIFQAVEDWLHFKGLCGFAYVDDYYLAGIPFDLRDLYQQAYDEGARVHSNSWGTNWFSTYNVDSANTDDFIWNNPDMTITFSAGNEGGDAFPFDGEIDICQPDPDPASYSLSCRLASPGTAKNVITVGASENHRETGYPCDVDLDDPIDMCDDTEGQNAILTYAQTWIEFAWSNIANDPIAGNAEQMAGFSSRGPSDDGRIKPDVVAPGTWVLSGYSEMFQEANGGSPNPQNGNYQYDGWGVPNNENYKYMGGTSMSNPLVAGGAAVVRDYYQKAHIHSASAALVKATLINSAVDMLDENNDGEPDNYYPIPNGHEGWGRVNLANATDDSHEFVEETTGLSTDGSATYQFEVPQPPEGETTSPFKVSLVWSDHPDTEWFDWLILGAVIQKYPGPNLVNDLDLVVTSPGAEPVTYKGNNFIGGWTQPDGSADHINNVENAYIQSPEAGIWTVEVTGYNTPFGPQPYALVVDGVVLSGPAPDTEAPAVSVDTPNGGESLTVGTAYDITWTATDNAAVTSVDLSYSADGVNFTAISSGETNDGTYNWMPPSAMAEAYIRVMAHDAAGYTGQDISNAAFSISEAGGGSPASVAKIVMRIDKKGPNFSAVAEVYSDRGTVVEGDFTLAGEPARTTSGTVGRKGFAKLTSNKYQGIGGSGQLFGFSITSPTEGVLACSISVDESSPVTCNPPP